MFSKRLIELASLIPIKSKVVDVGCDHGLLDVYLTLNRKCHCIASDINEKCLSQAKVNIKKFGLEKEIKTILSDGLTNIEYNSSDYIVIAGMGSTTILDILKNNHADNLIVQSNTDLEELREELCDDYIIKEEKVIKDHGIYYVIIRFEKGHKNYNSHDYFIGPIIKKKNDGIYLEYKKHLLDKYNAIYDEIGKTNLNKRLEIKRLINIIKKYI